MATKNKHRKKRVSPDPLHQIERLLEKGDAKQALKDAKVFHRQQPSPETRRLLERAYLARGRQLYRAGLRDECRVTLENLLELGTSDTTVQGELPKLLIAVGLFDRAGVGGKDSTPLEDGDPLLAAAADHAVLRPGEAPQHLPAIGQGAKAVRRSLGVLEAGGEAEAALAELKDIASGSPLADWKLFVRGLAAYYRDDAAQMQANWERLDADRAAARIAAALQALADPARPEATDCQTANAVARLGRQVFGGPVLEGLGNLQSHLAAGRWPEAAKSLRASGRLFGQVDPTLPARIAMILAETFIHKGAVAAIGDLAAAIEPLPIDPHWNRALALAMERSEDDDPAEAERYWRAYLDDLAQVDCLAPADRTLAQALVWLRLAGLLVDDSGPMCPSCGVRHDPDEETRDRAVECFENSLELAPDLLAAYRSLADAYAEWEEPDEAAATYRRLAERFPENLEALRFLASHYLKRDEPFAAGEFVFRAQRLKPLDPEIRAMVASAHLESARQHALAGRWDEGRAELAAAEKVDGQPIPTHHLLACRAALEFKAGEFGLGHRLIDRAGNERGESAPVWLLVTIAGIRYALPKTVAGEFENRWRMALKKGRRSAVAGELCQITVAHLAAGVSYRGQEEHVGYLLDFLWRCVRIKWQPDDLRDVLDFLLFCEHRLEKREKGSAGHAAPSEIAELLAKLGVTARAKFPEYAFFQYVVGELEIRKGPRACDRQLALGCFQRGLALVAGKSDPDSVQLAKRAQKNIDFLREADRVSSAMDDDVDEDGEDDGPFDLEDDGPEIPTPAGIPGKLFRTFVNICRTLGLDPEQVLDEAAAGKPLSFRTGDGRSAARKKRK